MFTDRGLGTPRDWETYVYSDTKPEPIRLLANPDRSMAAYRQSQGTDLHELFALHDKYVSIEDPTYSRAAHAIDRVVGAKPHEETHAILWNALVEKGLSVGFEEELSFFRVKIGAVSDKVMKSGHVGPVIIGGFGPLGPIGAHADSLGATLCDKDGTPLAVVHKRDVSSGAVLNHMGLKPFRAMLFIGHSGGYLPSPYLYIIAVFEGHEASSRSHSICWHPFQGTTFVRTWKPEFLEDVPMDFADAELLAVDDMAVLRKKGANESFAELPASLAGPCLALMKTGYTKEIVACKKASWSIIPDGAEYSFLSVSHKRPEEIMRLAKMREYSHLDLDFDSDYEVISLEPKKMPYDIPFGEVEVECVAVPIKNRKNPSAQLTVNGSTVLELRLRDTGYESLMAHAGLSALHGSLHYGDDDLPQLYVVWAKRRKTLTSSS